MSRAFPWRNKPTPFITQMIPIAKQLKLYLVNQIGPTSLLLKDDHENKFKVVIGNTISCSCGIVKNDHCIHTLFVLLKKFKVNVQHPILWQASYIDSQLDGLAQHKYQYLGTGSKKKDSTNFTTFLKKKQIQKNQQEDFFPPLSEDQMCPICYQQMNGQCYSTCQVCNKSLHTHCFKVWTKHKQDSKTNVTCPMCRTVFLHPMKIIFRDLQRWEQRFSTHKGTYCYGCGSKNIKGLIYKCLLCPKTDLCKMCYQGNQHIDHSIFVVKELVTDKWKIAPFRIKKTRKQLFQYITQINLKQFPSIQSPQFILKLLPTFKTFNNSQTEIQFGVIGNQMLNKQFCVKCQTQGNQMMIRLNCGHGVHQECLLYMFQNKEYFCQLDDEVICPGYLCALGIKISKTKKPKPKIEVGTKFIRNNEQAKIINQKNLQNPFSITDYQKQRNDINFGINKKVKQKLTISQNQFKLINKKNNQQNQIQEKNYILQNRQHEKQRQRKQLTVNKINRISGKILNFSSSKNNQRVNKSKDNKNFRINLSANSNVNKKSILQIQRQKKIDIQALNIGGFGVSAKGKIGIMSSVQHSNANNNHNNQVNISQNSHSRPPLNKKIIKNQPLNLNLNLNLQIGQLQPQKSNCIQNKYSPPSLFPLEVQNDQQIQQSFQQQRDSYHRQSEQIKNQNIAKQQAKQRNQIHQID